MTKGVKNKGYLTPGDVADLLMISPIRVRQLALNGDLKSVSTPGGHRRFLHHDVEKFARDKGLTLKLPSSDSLSVLVVDDDVQLTGFLVDLFAELDQEINIDISHDGFNAGMKVLSFKPHIVLLDLMMPGIDGFEVCRIIKENPVSKGIRVIAMTGEPTSENVKRIREAGAEECLAKPLEIEQLFRALGLNYQKTQHISN